jgi:predicted acylesterase/phospholipase RssA
MSGSYKYSVPKVQRALVLQGGGALGAYQAGVFKSLYEKMKRIKTMTVMITNYLTLLQGLL